MAALGAEAAKASGGCLAAALFDCSKCYERLHLAKVVERARDEGYPPVIIRMAVDQYRYGRL
eukprot:7538611-Alexandrium_andersonii.AAC.1